MTGLRPYRTHSLSFTAAALLLCASCGDDSIVPNDADSTGGDTTIGATSAPPPTTESATTEPPQATTATDPTASTDDGPDSSAGETATSECGNGMIETGEMCDDGNADDGDGCSASCSIDEGWYCDGSVPSECTTICGDRVIGAPAETCDDGNTDPGDECTNTCQTAECGDGVIWVGMEACDDGKASEGCSDTCTVNPGFFCGGEVPCYRAAFVADGAGDVTGNLYAMALDGSHFGLVAPLTESLTGLAFDPDGVLYGVTSTQGGSPSVLGTIDTATGTFTSVGQLLEADGTAHEQMPDITFMGGQLVGWTENGDDLVLIDAATAIVTPVDTPQGSSGTALAYDPATDQIFLAPVGANSSLFIVDELGTVTEQTVLGGEQGAVKGMSFYDGALYGMDIGNDGGGSGDFVTYDTATGTAVALMPLPSLNIDALAIYDEANVAPPM